MSQPRVKLFALLVPRDGMSTLDFYAHWRYVHGPLAGRIRRAVSYVQCHRLPLQPAELPVLPHGGTAEVEFVDMESANGLLEDPDYTTGAAHDEDNFHHMDRMTALQTTGHVVLAGPPIRQDTGGIKVLQFVRRSAGSSLEQFRDAWLSPAEGETEPLEALRCLRSRRWAQVPAPDGAEPQRFDGVREMWWPDQWSFDIAREREAAAWCAATQGPGIDGAASGFLATVENRVVWPENSTGPRRHPDD
ncbi:MAG: EthD domain-containing protein [Solirubrobacteraceae bacterium]